MTVPRWGTSPPLRPPIMAPFRSTSPRWGPDLDRVPVQSRLHFECVSWPNRHLPWTSFFRFSMDTQWIWVKFGISTVAAFSRSPHYGLFFGIFILFEVPKPSSNRMHISLYPSSTRFYNRNNNPVTYNTKPLAAPSFMISELSYFLVVGACTNVHFTNFHDFFVTYVYSFQTSMHLGDCIPFFLFSYLSYYTSLRDTVCHTYKLSSRLSLLESDLYQ